MGYVGLDAVQAQAMLTLQDSMNAKIHSQWRHANFAFLRAVVVEGAEALEHHGWKWWKAQSCDWPQLRLELVDIWHFMLSDVWLQFGDRIDDAALYLVRQSAGASEPHAGVEVFDGREYHLHEMSFVDKLELMIGLAAARRHSIGLFAAMLADAGMSWDELYRQYIGKNILNRFRQDHGYKEGTYRKQWNGREDNEHLVELATQCDATSPHFSDWLYEALAKRYADTGPKAK